jgi:hypothetical protein
VNDKRKTAIFGTRNFGYRMRHLGNAACTLDELKEHLKALKEQGYYIRYSKY